MFFERANKRRKTRFTLFIRKYAIHFLYFYDFDSDIPNVKFLAIFYQNGLSALEYGLTRTDYLLARSTF